MATRIYTPQRIVNKLREAKVPFSHASIVGEAARNIEVTEQTYYHWRREHGGVRIDEAKQPKEPEPGRLIA